MACIQPLFPKGSDLVYCLSSRCTASGNQTMHVTVVPPDSLLEPAPPPPPSDVTSLMTSTQTQYHHHPTSSSSSFMTTSSSMLSSVGGPGTIMTVEDVLNRVPAELQGDLLRTEPFVQEGEVANRSAEQLIKEAIGVHSGEEQLTTADTLTLQSLSGIGFHPSAPGHSMNTSHKTT